MSILHLGLAYTTSNSVCATLIFRVGGRSTLDWAFGALHPPSSALRPMAGGCERDPAALASTTLLRSASANRANGAVALRYHSMSETDCYEVHLPPNTREHYARLRRGHHQALLSFTAAFRCMCSPPRHHYCIKPSAPLRRYTP